MSAVRIALGGLAVVACAWFALAIRADRNLSAVRASVGHAKMISAIQASAAEARLRQAATLNPDQAIPVLRAQVELHAGQPRAALATARAVVAHEPGNPDNWLVLEVVSFRIAPAITRLAQAQLHRLVPPAGGGG